MSSFLRFQRDYERSGIIERVNQKAVSQRGKQTIGTQSRSRSSQNLHLGSLNRYSSLLKHRLRHAPFRLTSGLGQIDEEKSTLKKRSMNMSKSFKVTSLGKVNTKPADISSLKDKSISQSVEEEQKIPPFDEVSDSPSVSQEEEVDDN